MLTSSFRRQKNSKIALGNVSMLATYTESLTLKALGQTFPYQQQYMLACKALYCMVFQIGQIVYILIARMFSVVI